MKTGEKLILSRRQEEIIEAAIKLIAEGGTKNLTIKNLSLEIKLSEAAIYRHFKSKDEILQCMIQSFSEQSSKILKQAVGLDITAFEKLEFFILSRAEIFSKNPKMAQILFSEILFQNHPILREEIKFMMGTHKKLISSILEEGRRSSQIRQDLSIDNLFRIVLGSVRLLITQWNFSGLAFDLKQESKKLLESLKLLLSV